MLNNVPKFYSLNPIPSGLIKIAEKRSKNYDYCGVTPLLTRYLLSVLASHNRNNMCFVVHFSFIGVPKNGLFNEKVAFYSSTLIRM